MKHLLSVHFSVDVEFVSFRLFLFNLFHGVLAKIMILLHQDNFGVRSFANVFDEAVFVPSRPIFVIDSFDASFGFSQVVSILNF